MSAYDDMDTSTEYEKQCNDIRALGGDPWSLQLGRGMMLTNMQYDRGYKSQEEVLAVINSDEYQSKRPKQDG